VEEDRQLVGSLPGGRTGQAAVKETSTPGISSITASISWL